jgi:O-antigen/teichoic acid export membrane protein
VYLRNLLANYVGTAWTTAMGVAFVPFYVSHLGLESYGVLGAFVLLQYVVGFIDNAIAPLLIKEVSRCRSGASGTHELPALRVAILRLLLVLSGVLLLAVVASSPFLVRSLANRSGVSLETYAVAVPALGMACVLRVIEGYYRSILIGSELQVRLNVVTCVLVTVRSVGAFVVLAAISPTLWAFGLWQLGMAVVSVAAFAIAAPRANLMASQSVAASVAVVRSHWRFGGGLMGLTGLTVAIALVERSVLFSVLSLEQFGVYTLAVTIAGATGLVSLPTGQVLNARVAGLEAAGHRAESVRLIRSTTQVLAVLVGAIGATLCLLADRFIYAWTGSTELVDEVSMEVGLLAASAALNSFTVVPYRCRLAVGETRYWMIANALAAAICIPGYVITAPRYGVIGIACVACVVNLLLVTVASPISLHSLLGSTIRRWLSVDVGIVVCGATIVAALVRFGVADGVGSRWESCFMVAGSLILSATAASLCGSYVRQGLWARLMGVLR